MSYLYIALITTIFLAILIITHEFGHFIVAKLFKLRVDEFAFGFPPKIFSKKKGETTYSLNAIPFGGFVKIYGETAETLDGSANPEELKRSFYYQPAWKRTLILVAGIAMNFLVGWFAFAVFLFFTGIPQSVYIDKVIAGSPAENAGLAAGDKISGYSRTQDFISYIDKNAGETIPVNGKNVMPRINPPANEGRLGVLLKEGDYKKFDVFASLYRGFTESVQVVVLIFGALGGLVIGIFRGGNALQQLSGPVGIVEQISAASHFGVLYLIQFLGLISLNLAVFNFLPIPALDGGRIFFILIETIIGRKISRKHETIAITIGFALLILLAITVTVHDIYRLIS